ncbi:hypothetical protein ACLOJK_037794 [Asimina triloba]
MDYAFEWVIQNHGIDTESDYPYLSRDGICYKEKKKHRVVTIDGYVDVPPNNEQQLLQAVAAQPVSVGLCGSERAFQLYSQGIFNGPCSTSLDHAGLLVGYGSQNGVDYWIMKNSWGKSWGMDGYIHMLRSGGNSEGLEALAVALQVFLEFAFHGVAVDLILQFVARTDVTAARMIILIVTPPRSTA